MGKIISLVFVLLLFLSAMIAGFAGAVAAEGTIYIRADGSVEGTTAIRRDGNVYTFTGNIYDSIVVEKDNIVVDGAGYTLQGKGNGRESTYIVGNGVELLGRNNVTIKNMRIQCFYCGVHLDHAYRVYTGNFSNNNVISGNYLTNNAIGIQFFAASHNTISENNIINNNVGIALIGETNNTIQRNYIIGNKVGIGFATNLTNSVLENYVAHNEVGLYFGGNPPFVPASNKLILHNSFVRNTKQIEDYHWTESFSKPSINVWDDGKKGNYWSDYTGKDADGDGIGDAPYVIDENNRDNYPLMRNLIPPLETTLPTITVVSPENKAYSTSNISLTMVLSEPALWMGYSLNGQSNITVAGNTTLTGLLDGTYNLTVYAKGVFENTGASEPVHFTVDTVRPNISILSPENQTYTVTDIPLTFTVNEHTSWMGYSLDGQDNVTIAGNTTLTGLPEGAHNIKVYAKDTAGNTSTSETIYFSVKVPFLTMLVAVAAVASAATAATALFIYFRKRKH